MNYGKKVSRRTAEHVGKIAMEVSNVHLSRTEHASMLSWPCMTEHNRDGEEARTTVCLAQKQHHQPLFLG